jgi:hypothetical protein
MKQYRQGRDVKQLLELLTYRSGILTENRCVKQKITAVRIHRDRHLWMRHQTAYVIPPRRSNLSNLLDQDLMICPHLGQGSLSHNSIIANIREALVALAFATWGHEEHVMSCHCVYCPTKFWIRLGTGRRLFMTICIVAFGHRKLPMSKSLLISAFRHPRMI